MTIKDDSHKNLFGLFNSHNAKLYRDQLLIAKKQGKRIKKLKRLEDIDLILHLNLDARPWCPSTEIEDLYMIKYTQQRTKIRFCEPININNFDPVIDFHQQKVVKSVISYLGIF